MVQLEAVPNDRGAGCIGLGECVADEKDAASYHHGGHHPAAILRASCTQCGKREVDKKEANPVLGIRPAWIKNKVNDEEEKAEPPCQVAQRQQSPIQLVTFAQATAFSGVSCRSRSRREARVNALPGGFRSTVERDAPCQVARRTDTVAEVSKIAATTEIRSYASGRLSAKNSVQKIPAKAKAERSTRRITSAA